MSGVMRLRLIGAKVKTRPTGSRARTDVGVYATDARRTRTWVAGAVLEPGARHDEVAAATSSRGIAVASHRTPIKAEGEGWRGFAMRLRDPPLRLGKS
jgi:hypothetical protein